jgi:DNA-binding transcriptional ArsR family regulator
LRKNPLKPIKTIRDPEAFQLLADETRRKIMFLLRVKEMTVSQIAAELDITPQAVYHHVRKLLKGGVVEVTHEERIGHLIESYYRTTAETFNFQMGKTSYRTAHSQKLLKEQEISALNALKKLGFNLELDENRISQLVKVRTEIDKCCSSTKTEDEIANLDDLDFPTRLLVSEYAEILSMSNEEFAREQELTKQLRETLHSFVKK